VSAYDIAIIGGGPAGTSAAITAARRGARVLLLERSRLPRHKVCGEFVSAESLALLHALLNGTPGARLPADAPRMHSARIFLDGAVVQAPLPAPAASIERYSLDLALWRAAEHAGTDARMQTAVEKIARENHLFRLHTTGGEFGVRCVVDATGRWSNLRPTAMPANYGVGVKAHFETGVAEPDTVDLYFWSGGYCGVSRVNANEVNVCALIDSSALRPGGQPPLEHILDSHPDLRHRRLHWKQRTDVVITSPLLFGGVVPESDGVVRAGDAAGFLDPFAGDGISLALRSGTLAAECLRRVWQDGGAVEMAAREYATAYSRQFARLFRRTALLRRALATPLFLHAIRLGILRQGMLDFLIKATRAA
jgi:flavin-dependent dehydrogenase